jgi:hypothetical protein
MPRKVAGLERFIKCGSWGTIKMEDGELDSIALDDTTIKFLAIEWIPEIFTYFKVKLKIYIFLS